MGWNLHKAAVGMGGGIRMVILRKKIFKFGKFIPCRVWIFLPPVPAGLSIHDFLMPVWRNEFNNDPSPNEIPAEELPAASPESQNSQNSQNHCSGIAFTHLLIPQSPAEWRNPKMRERFAGFILCSCYFKVAELNLDLVTLSLQQTRIFLTWA